MLTFNLTSPDSSIMTGIRALLTVLIAISVGIAPVSGGVDVPTTPIEMSMPDNANMPCCPPDDSKASLTCGLKCFNVAGALFPNTILLPEIVNRPLLSFVNETLVGHVSPPTHPPPI
jgi:hypothetical protein